VITFQLNLLYWGTHTHTHTCIAHEHPHTQCSLGACAQVRLEKNCPNY